MKLYTISFLAAILFSSCLKESIADAMLDDKKSHSVTATLSYKVNGDAVNLSVEDADNQYRGSYSLGCEKYPNYYIITGLSDGGEFEFPFYTDSLTVGNYKYTSTSGEMFFINHNGNDYIHAPLDSMSLNITSYTNGHISGNFSGVLTPLLITGSVNNEFGDPGSVLITGGSFENVPVWY